MVERYLQTLVDWLACMVHGVCVFFSPSMDTVLYTRVEDYRRSDPEWTSPGEWD